MRPRILRFQPRLNEPAPRAAFTRSALAAQCDPYFEHFSGREAVSRGQIAAERLATVSNHGRNLWYC